MNKKRNAARATGRHFYRQRSILDNVHMIHEPQLYNQTKTRNDSENKSPLEGALEMAALGFYVFPLRPGTKDGFYSKSWKAAATKDAAAIKRIAARYKGCNWGVRCVGHLVLDVDVADGKKGEEALFTLDLEHGLPLTREHASARGGRHIPMSLPEGVEVTNRDAPLGGGINVRGAGGYIVCPGSTFDGKPYTVAIDAPIAPAPASLIELLRAPGAVKGGAVPEEHQDHPADIARSIDWLQHRPVAVKGERGISVYKAACRLRDWGLTQETAHELVADHYGERMEPPCGFDECAHEVGSAYKNAQNSAGARSVAADFEDVSDLAAEIEADHKADAPERVAAGGPIAWPRVNRKTNPKTGFETVTVLHTEIENIRAHLKYVGADLWVNEFDGRPYLDASAFGYSGHVSDAARNRVRLDAYAKGLHSPKQHYNDVFDNEAHLNRRHPLRDYLKSLNWDGGSRAERLFIDYAGAPDTPLNREAGKLLLVAAVRRVMQPGSKFDYMVVLEGAQGSGKSSFVQLLAKEWSNENFSLEMSAKNIVEELRGSWIVEVPELSGLRSTKGREHMKALVTRTKDGARRAYAQFAETVPREWVLIATTNDKRYLTDPTGNRRFLPVAAPKTDFKALARDVDQLWAEACVLERTHGILDLPGFVKPALAKMLTAREDENPSLDILAERFADRLAEKRIIPVMDAWDAVFGKRTHPGRRNAEDVSNAMSVLGYERIDSNAMRRFDYHGAAFVPRGYKPGPRLAEHQTSAHAMLN